MTRRSLRIFFEGECIGIWLSSLSSLSQIYVCIKCMHSCMWQKSTTTICFSLTLASSLPSPTHPTCLWPKCLSLHLYVATVSARNDIRFLLLLSWGQLCPVQLKYGTEYRPFQGHYIRPPFSSSWVSVQVPGDPTPDLLRVSHPLFSTDLSPSTRESRSHAPSHSTRVG